MTAPDITSLLPRLQRWYEEQCDGDWEHGHGMHIQTLDNPGWMLTVNLEGTRQEGKPFNPIERGLNPDLPDWIDCRVKDGCFTAAGGPRQLAEMIATFLIWVDDQSRTTDAQ